MSKVKDGAGQRRTWTGPQLAEALVEIRMGHTVNSVSKRYNIPRTTLLSKRDGRVPVDATYGPSPILAPEEEKSVVDWILLCSSRSFPVTKTQLTMSVAHFIKIKQRVTPFKNGIPGRHWYNGFMRRHPQISSRIAQNLTSSRSQITEGVLRTWFAEVGSHLNENSLKG